MSTAKVCKLGLIHTYQATSRSTHHFTLQYWVYTAVGGVDGTCGAPVEGNSTFAWTAIGVGSGRGCRLTHKR